MPNLKFASFWSAHVQGDIHFELEGSTTFQNQTCAICNMHIPEIERGLIIGCGHQGHHICLNELQSTITDLGQAPLCPRCHPNIPLKIIKRGVNPLDLRFERIFARNRPKSNIQIGLSWVSQVKAHSITPLIYNNLFSLAITPELKTLFRTIQNKIGNDPNLNQRLLEKYKTIQRTKREEADLDIRGGEDQVYRVDRIDLNNLLRADEKMEQDLATLMDSTLGIELEEYFYQSSLLN